MEFKYVGPNEILNDVVDAPMGDPIREVQDILVWRDEHTAEIDDDSIIATFTVGVDGVLRLASRNSEHVACAGGGPVLTAGELSVLGDGSVENITNQSTGFCPSEDSWEAIAHSLDKAGIQRPTQFSSTIIFRKCPNCREHNLVKDDWFVCTFCDSDLPADWNFHLFYEE